MDDYATLQELMKAQVKSTDQYSNGLYYWSPEDWTVETVATGRIFTGFFNLDALSSGMPRKLYFDGADTSLLGVSVINVTGRWEMPEGEETSISLPAMDGAYYHHTRLKERNIEVKCLVKQASMAGLATAERELNTLLDPHKGECELRFDDEYFYIYQARFKGKTVIDSAGSNEICKLLFTASKPFIYGPAQYYNTSGSALLLNRGSQQTPIKLTIRGPAVFPVISLGDKQIIINTPLTTSNDEFMIDSEKLEISLNGAPAAHLAEGDFLCLSPGETEIIVSSGILEIEFSERWL